MANERIGAHYAREWTIMNPCQVSRKRRNDMVALPDRWWADIGSIRNFIAILRDPIAYGGVRAACMAKCNLTDSRNCIVAS